MDYQQCLTCLVRNPENIVLFVLRGFGPPSGPFKYLQLDVIKLPVSISYQYVLVTVCVFSLLQSCCPCRKNKWTITKELKCVSQLRYIFHYLQWSRHLCHWTNHRSLNKNVTNFLINFISIQPSVDPFLSHANTINYCKSLMSWAPGCYQ